jgi:hypothetical protein
MLTTWVPAYITEQHYLHNYPNSVKLPLNQAGLCRKKGLRLSKAHYSHIDTLLFCQEMIK